MLVLHLRQLNLARAEGYRSFELLHIDRWACRRARRDEHVYQPRQLHPSPSACPASPCKLIMTIGGCWVKAYQMFAGLTARLSFAPSERLHSRQRVGRPWRVSQPLAGRHDQVMHDLRLRDVGEPVVFHQVILSSGVISRSCKQGGCSVHVAACVVRVALTLLHDCSPGPG